MNLGERMGLKLDVESLQRNKEKNKRKNKSTEKAVTSVEAS